MATFCNYNIYDDNSNSKITFSKVRIYGVPNDIPGSRFITDWRATRPKHFAIEKNLKFSWPRLLQYLDFSLANWGIPSQLSFHQFFNNAQSLLLIDVQDTSKVEEKESSSDLNFHIQRWSFNNHYYKEIGQHSGKDSLGSKVQKIYNQIDSPDLSYYDNKIVNSGSKSWSIPSTKDVLITLVNNAKKGITTIDGVKSDLYPFQIRSIAKMYEKESLSRKSLIPSFVKIPSIIDNESFYYFDFQTYLLYSKPEVYTLPRGGILAENMGLGKTLICLSLICLSKFEVSKIPDDLLLHDDKEELEIEELIKGEDGDLIPSKPKYIQGMRSLVDICKEIINQNSLSWKFYAKDLSNSVIDVLSNDPGYFRIKLIDREYESQFSLRTRNPSLRRKLLEEDQEKEGNIYRTLYLCNTTLIIVPDNLFQQWISEFRKHIQGDFLRRLFISSQVSKSNDTEYVTYTKELPMDPKELVKFDLILLTHSYFARKVGDLSVDENPLNHIYWKRLIIDEGHIMNSKSSKTSELCKTLHSERRWAVTGTPTTGLTRLHMDEEETENKDLHSPKKKNKYVIKNEFNEKADLVKLGTIIGNFLKIEPFHTQPKTWMTNVIRPLTLNIYGAEENLKNLLNTIVIRHNLNDVEQDLKLPQLHHEAIFLEPSFHNKISVNLFTAVLAVNAVSSERTDIDYMFHPSNRQQLRRLVTNLQRATFHWTGFKQEDIETLIHICNVSLKKRKPDGSSVYSDYDYQLLQQSLEAAKIALENTRWRTAALLHEMHYYVKGLPDLFTNYFGTGVLERVDNVGNRDDIGVFGAPHINTIQEFFYKNRFLDMNDEEKLKEKLSLQSGPFWDVYWKDNVRRNAARFNKQDANQNLEANIKGGAIAKAINTPDLVKDFTPEHELRNEGLKNSNGLNPSLKEKLQNNYGQGLQSTNSIHSNNQEKTYQSIRKSEILGTASAKLSYLGARLLEHQQEDSAYYLTEMMDVLGINYIMYATFINSIERGKNLSLFSGHDCAEEGGITLVIDLKLASHGLTIISATRVYFINPVWQRSVEAQAIKRAHRIGQNNEVFVETLVLRGTLEEEIYKRRLHNYTDSEQSKRFVIDDHGMQQYILKHNFLPYHSNESEYTPFTAPSLYEEPMKNAQVLSDDNYELPEHQSRSIVNSILKSWKIFTFSQQNYEKFMKLKTSNSKGVNSQIKGEKRKSGDSNVKKRVRF